MSVQDSSGAFVAGLIVGICMIFLCLVVFAEPYWVSNNLRAKAVELGVAEWKVNPKDGTTKFEWKEPTKP